MAYEELLDELDHEIERKKVWWNPEPGDQIVGTVTKIIESYTGGQYGPYPIVIISVEMSTDKDGKNKTIELSDTGELPIHCNVKALREDLYEALKPVDGDVLAIRFEGQDPPANGRNGMKRFKASKKAGTGATAAPVAVAAATTDEDLF